MRGDPEPIGAAARTEDRASTVEPNLIPRGTRTRSGAPAKTVETKIAAQKEIVVKTARKRRREPASTGLKNFCGEFSH